MQGNDTDQTRSVREFVTMLGSTLPIGFMDEAGTSLEAEARLRSRGRPYVKADIDKEAAAIILTDWLAQHPKEQ
jgi:RNase H-fold protein (predicted Holliday junction resolvase)